MSKARDRKPRRGFLLDSAPRLGHGARMHWITKFVTLPIAAVTGAIFAVGMMASDADAPAARNEGQQDPTAGMREACARFIQRDLHNPNSFRRVDFSAWPSQANEDGTVTVAATYRASNAFGATVTERTICQLEAADGNVRLIALR